MVMYLASYIRTGHSSVASLYMSQDRYSLTPAYKIRPTPNKMVAHLSNQANGTSSARIAIPKPRYTTEKTRERIKVIC